ncbi:uncharacterized protein LOC127002390 [Eriocheir sinensis]|uniref:uncharacterized protein LOC127002390 n=1 Tax=Eriocheir sinensis TaxID=95602 RepID=UPI0021C90986|nr:uncharacterized protein LOC127002390 [Eriocheir sinensis]
MVRINVASLPKPCGCSPSETCKLCEPCDSPQESSGCHSASDVLLVLFVVFLKVVAAASVVVGAVPLFRCIDLLLLDYWLIVNGITALGALAGLMVWSNKMATGRFINGPKVLASLLFALHFTWLLLGNILVVAAYVTCGQNTFLGTISCTSWYLHFALVVIIIFDIAYIVLFVFFCLACNSDSGEEGWTHPALGESGCCARPSCLSTFYGVHCSLSWQEWVILLVLVGYTLLAIVSLALGSVFLGMCSDDVWEPLWLIVHGVVTLVTFSTALCCCLFPNWVEISWSRSNFTVFLPLLILGLIEVLWIAYGNSQAIRYLVLSCPTNGICNGGLQVFTLVLLALLDLPFLVLTYVGIIFFILITILLIISGCYVCCHKDNDDEEEEDACENDVSNDDSSDDCSGDIGASGCTPSDGDPGDDNAGDNNACDDDPVDDDPGDDDPDDNSNKD